MERLSDVRLAIDSGLISEVPPAVMNELLVITQPGFCRRRFNRDYESEDEGHSAAPQ